MRRREFLVLAACAACPALADAQQDRTRRVGVLTGNIETDPDAQVRVRSFRQGLADLGWVEGRNLQLEVRWPGPDLSRQQSHAGELVALAPDVILTTSTATTRVLRAATQAIPIVFVGLSDPVATGIVSNIARPEANATGLMLYEHSLAGKWLSLLKDIAPSLKRVAVLFNPRTSPYAAFYLRTAQETAGGLGLTVTPAVVNDASEIDPALAAMAGADCGLMVLPDGGFVASNNATLIALAAKYRVPAIYAVRAYAANGGLMSYGADLTLQFRDGASYVDQILRGAKPAELPVRFAAKFDLVINAAAARALGLNVPRHLMVAAEMIQ